MKDELTAVDIQKMFMMLARIGIVIPMGVFTILFQGVENAPVR